MIKKALFIGLILIEISAFAQNYKFGKVSKKELQEKFHPGDSTADAAYLHRFRKTYYEYNPTKKRFYLVNEIHNRIKIYTKEGFDKSTLTIPFYNYELQEKEEIPDIKGVTFNLENGKTTKQKLVEKDIFLEKTNSHWSRMKITMPNIKVGCVIDFSYKLVSPYIQKIDDFNFQYDIPVKHLDYAIELPEYYQVKQQAKGYYYVKPKETEKTDFISFTTKTRTGEDPGFSAVKTEYHTSRIDYLVNVTRFKTKDIPALKSREPFISNINNYRGGVSFELSRTDFLSIGGGVQEYSNSWENVTDMIYDSNSFGDELKKSNYYKEDLKQIIAAKNSEFEKAIAIFEFVKNRIKLNNFIGKYTLKGVRRAYKERSGNIAEISLILTSMLRSAGLNANPVLVSTRSNGIPLFPTLEGFNYIITNVDFKDGKSILLDASDKFSIPNNLPSRVLNWKGRKIYKKGVSSWVELLPSKYASVDNNLMVTLSEDLAVNGVVRTKFSNYEAYNFRKRNHSVNDNSLRNRLEERSNIEIENFKIINKDNLLKPIIRNVKFSSEDLVEVINNKIYIEPTLFLTKRWNPFKVNERKFPVDFNAANKKNNIVTIQVPEGFTIESLPETVTYTLPDNLGVYNYQVKQIGNIIKTISILKFNSPIIPPEHYQKLKEFYANMIAKETEKNVLIKS